MLECIDEICSNSSLFNLYARRYLTFLMCHQESSDYGDTEGNVICLGPRSTKIHRYLLVVFLAKSTQMFRLLGKEIDNSIYFTLYKLWHCPNAESKTYVFAQSSFDLIDLPYPCTNLNAVCQVYHCPFFFLFSFAHIVPILNGRDSEGHIIYLGPQRTKIHRYLLVIFLAKSTQMFRLSGKEIDNSLFYSTL
jgi:hypothetical protein